MPVGEIITAFATPGFVGGATALTLFGACNGSSTSSTELTTLITSLTSALDLSMGSGTPSLDVISSLSDALASGATGNNTLITQLVSAIENGIGQAEFGDSIWRVTGPDMPAGADVVVRGMEGATLIVTPLGGSRAD